MELIRNLFDIIKKDIAIAGGKGASLGEMTQAGIPVPPGFIILSEGFEQFIKDNNLNIEIDAIIDTINPKEVHTIENASEKIQALILNSEIPKSIANKIMSNFDKLGADFVAVRSSATSEDSASAAWAGQLDTFLNTSRSSLLENIKKCWASLFAPRAIFYRFEKKLQKEKISVAVVIQKMVNSEKSGIAFSVHPVTENYNQLIIEAGFGLGEAIVSGQITPDSYVVDKQDWHIVDININEQSKGLFRKNKGGNEWKDLKEKNREQVLNKEEIIELSKLIVKIERHYGFACDIEWAKEKGKFYITQSRPITTLTKGSAKKRISKIAKNEKKIYKKVMNRSLPLVSCQYWDLGERVELPKVCKNSLHFTPLFIYKKGKGISIYYDYTEEIQDPKNMTEYFNKNKEKFNNLVEKYLDESKELSKIAKNKDVRDLNLIFKKMAKFWPALTLSSLLGDKFSKNTSKEISKKAYNLRSSTDQVLYDAGNFLFELIEENISKEDSWFLSFEEISSDKIPSKEAIKKRKESFVYFKGKLYNSLDKVKKDFNIKIVEENFPDSNVLKGNVACKGKAKGKVKVVFELKQLSKVKQGDILVTPMTTPDFMTSMKKCSAIITDEGGITSHAAIFSRELKKPCIIGTQVATKVLKDGDEVEVDANKGTIKILKRHSK